MAKKLQLPTPQEVKGLFGDLFGAVVEGRELEVTDFGASMVGYFGAEDGQRAIVCGCDLALVNYAGAALTMVPTHVAEEYVRTRDLPDNIVENFREVLNIMGVTLNKSDAEHVVLSGVFAPGDAVSADLARSLRSVEKRFDMEIEVPEYGNGQLTFSLCS